MLYRWIILLAVSRCLFGFHLSGQAITNASPSSDEQGIVYVEGDRYPLTGAGLQAAITTACNDGKPGKVVLPAQMIVDIAVNLVISSSNCTIEGQGKDVSVLKVSSSYGRGNILSTSPNLSHLHFRHFTVDGNRANNANIFDCMDVSGIDITFEEVRVSNCRNQGLLIFGASASWKILNSEFDHDGRDISVEGTGGIRIAPAGPYTVSRIALGPGNSIHDNNVGIAILPPANNSNQTSEIRVFENRIYSNASDAIVVTANLPNGGPIADFSATRNSIWCNGWTGHEFPGCTAGFMQIGGAASSSGVGIDIIQLGSGLILRPVIRGNDMRDNTYEGLALTTYCWSRVRTSGKFVEQIGPSPFTHGTCPFDTDWKDGEAVTINGVSYLIASVASSTSLTLRTSAGNVENAGFAGNSSMNAVVSDNRVVHDGSGAVGPCFFDTWTSDVSFSNNFAKDCNLEGYVVGGARITFDGDKAISNNKGRRPGRSAGFNFTECLACRLNRVSTDDPAGEPTQTVGVSLGPATLQTVTSASILHGSKSEYVDSGTGNTRN